MGKASRHGFDFPYDIRHGAFLAERTIFFPTLVMISGSGFETSTTVCQRAARDRADVGMTGLRTHHKIHLQVHAGSSGFQLGYALQTSSRIKTHSTS